MTLNGVLVFAPAFLFDGHGAGGVELAPVNTLTYLLTYFAFFSPKSTALQADYVIVVGVIAYL